MKTKLTKNDIFSSILLDLPYSKTEDILLAFILKDNNFYRDTIDVLKLDLFYTQNAKELFLSIKEKIDTRAESKNPATFESLQKTEDHDFNIYLSVLQRKMIDRTVSFEEYEDILRELEHYSKIRAGLTLTVELQKYLTNNKVARIDKKEAFIAEFVTNFSSIMQEDKTKFPLLNGKDFLETLENLEKGADIGSYLSSRYPELDEMGRIKGGQLIVIAGRPGMGKTSFALNLYEDFISNSCPSIYFSAEMSREEIIKKITNLLISKNTEHITDNNGVLKLTEEDWVKIKVSLEKMKNNLCFVDKPSLSLMEIKKYINERNFQGRLLAKKEGKENIHENDLKIIFIDYLQILNDSSTNPLKSTKDKISNITATLKGLALELNVAIVLLSQLNREMTKEKDKRPSMDQLKDSGSIEQDADKVYLLHREEYYQTKDASIPPEVKNAVKGIAEIIIDKQRNGTTGTLYLNWDGNLQLFNNISEKKEIGLNGEEYMLTKEEQIDRYLAAINGDIKLGNKQPDTPIYSWSGVNNKAGTTPFSS